MLFLAILCQLTFYHIIIARKSSFVLICIIKCDQCELSQVTFYIVGLQKPAGGFWQGSYQLSLTNIYYSFQIINCTESFQDSLQDSFICICNIAYPDNHVFSFIGFCTFKYTFFQKICFICRKFWGLQQSKKKSTEISLNYALTGEC